MRTAYDVPQLTLSPHPLKEVEADLIALPFFEERVPSLLACLDTGTRADVAGAIERRAARAEPGTVYLSPLLDDGWRARRVAIVGAGAGPPTREAIRRFASAAGLVARQQRLGTLVVALDPLEAAADSFVTSAAEGLVHACFDHGHLKSRDDLFWLSAGLISTGRHTAEGARAVAEARVTGEAVNAARLLANEPANHLGPRALAERASSLLDHESLSVRILDHDDLARLGMGLLLGVGQGSDDPPRLVVCEYVPDGSPAGGPVLALVGKGITFDTGGISIKPAEGLGRMKDDMAGAAAVIGAMRAIGQLGAPRRIVGVMPLAENMLSGRATRPGDVLRSASGLTVEVTNTDAEGRLILGDALWYARERGATHLVDVATLTGACVVALGMQITGLFARPDGWRDAIAAAAARAGETVWPMPLHEDYRELLKSDIADMINSPGRAAGAITAALFLEEFAGGVPWAHLDIAGTAWIDEAKPWAPKGATGAMVRTLIELARGGARDWPA
jgi:leucyl aminopeptidase